MITKKEQIKELKNEIEDLKLRLKIETEYKEIYRTFWQKTELLINEYGKQLNREYEIKKRNV